MKTTYTQSGGVSPPIVDRLGRSKTRVLLGRKPVPRPFSISSRPVSAYEIYNAALQNSWTVRECATEFGLSQDDIRSAIVYAGGVVSSRGRIG